MSFFKRLFGKREQPIETVNDFWKYFEAHAATFHKVVQEHKNIHTEFLDKIGAKLSQLSEGIFYLTGMYDDNTAELILTPDGNITMVAFIEDLVAAAPNIPNWRFTALKPSSSIENTNISMDGFDFSKDTLFFYENSNEEYPDEIDITMVHKDYSEANERPIVSGIYIFLDNYLGELNAIADIDGMSFANLETATEELVPIEKLKAYLNWRKKEFIEKYEGTRFSSDEDSYRVYEAKNKNQEPFIAVMNTSLLNWDSKASHPWILDVTFNFDGSENNGLPMQEELGLMTTIEDGIMELLKDEDGYLNIGRETGGNERCIYFACKEFRKPCIILPKFQRNYPQLDIQYRIYKDKYWRSFSHYPSE